MSAAQTVAVVHKVVAYAVRYRNGHAELLVFDHPDYPEAGTQVPAGTVEPDEAIEAALERELHEETGHTGFRRERLLGVFDHPEDGGIVHRRHVYLLHAPAGLPERWQWGERIGTPAAIRFAFYWLPLEPRPQLSGGLGDYLGAL